MLDQWAFFNQVELDFSRPATRTDNDYIESFNARLRQELLNASWFLSLADARARMEAWRKGQVHLRIFSHEIWSSYWGQVNGLNRGWYLLGILTLVLVTCAADDDDEGRGSFSGDLVEVATVAAKDWDSSGNQMPDARYNGSALRRT